MYRRRTIGAIDGPLESEMSFLVCFLFQLFSFSVSYNNSKNKFKHVRYLDHGTFNNAAVFLNIL